MATVAFGKTCPNCLTLVTCVGDDSAAQVFGKCPCCGVEVAYVIDPVAVAAAERAALAEQQAANIAANEAAAAEAEAEAQAAAAAAAQQSSAPPFTAPPGP